MKHQTDVWQLSTPDAVPEGSAPSVIVATIHPRGDQRLLKCIQSLLDQQCRVHVVWLGGEVGSRRFDGWLCETVLAGPHSTRERLMRTVSVLRRALRDTSSILYVHDFYMLPHAAIWKAMGRRRIVVFDSHEFYPELYSAKAPKILRPLALRSIKRLASSLCQVVDAFSLVAAEMLSPVQTKGKEVIITPNFPSQQMFAILPERRDEAARTRVIHSGSLTHAYGASVLLRAAAILERRGSKVRIDAVERFSSSSQREWFAEEYAKNGNPATLNMIPPRPAREMQALLSEYGAGLSLIQDEGQNSLVVPTKIYEYATTGLFVIASNLPAQSRFVRDSAGVSGTVFDARSAEALADCIERFETDRELAAVDRQAAAVIAQRDFSWEASCAPQFAMFRRLADRARLA